MDATAIADQTPDPAAGLCMSDGFADTIRLWHKLRAVDNPSPAILEALDELEAAAADAMIERYMVPSDRPGVYGHPGASPKQLQVVDSFFNGGYQVVAAFGSNQSGKTEAIGGLCFCRWLRDFAQDGDVAWIIAQDWPNIRDIPSKTLWKFLPRAMFPEDLTYSPKLGFGAIPTLHLTLPDGRGKCEVHFKNEEMDLKAFESSRVNLIWWTEARREAIFDALQPRLVARGGRMVMDYIPVEPWHSLRLQAGDNPNVFALRMCMMDNAHNLAPGAIEKARENMTPEQAAVRIDGKDGGSDGIVIKEYRHEYAPEGHLERTEPIPADWPVWVHIDVGKYTAALLLTVGEDGRKRVADEVYTLGLNVPENASEIKRMLERNGIAMSKVIAYRIDPAAYQYNAGNQVTVGEQYEQAGIPVEPWIATQSIGEEAMLDQVRVAFMRHELHIYDRCEHLGIELRTWRHKTDKDGKIDPKDRYEGPNHCIDSLKAWVAMKPTFADAKGDAWAGTELVDTGF